MIHDPREIQIWRKQYNQPSVYSRALKKNQFVAPAKINTLLYLPNVWKGTEKQSSHKAVLKSGETVNTNHEQAPSRRPNKPHIKSLAVASADSSQVAFKIRRERRAMQTHELPELIMFAIRAEESSRSGRDASVTLESFALLCKIFKCFVFFSFLSFLPAKRHLLTEKRSEAGLCARVESLRRRRSPSVSVPAGGWV